MLGAFPLFGGDTPVRVLIVFLATSLFVLTYFTIGIDDLDELVQNPDLRSSPSSSSGRSSSSIMPKLGDMVAAPRLSGPDGDRGLAREIAPGQVRSTWNRPRSSAGSTTSSSLGAPEGAADDAGVAGEKKVGRPIRDDIELRARERKAPAARRHRRNLPRSKNAGSTNLAVNLSLVSPSAAFARFIADVCGTGELERTNYVDAVRAHQKALDNELFSKVKRTVMIAPRAAERPWGSPPSPSTPQKLPKFSIAPASLAETFKANCAEPRLARSSG